VQQILNNTHSFHQDSFTHNGNRPQFNAAGGHERITNGKPALAHWIGNVETGFGSM